MEIINITGEECFKLWFGLTSHSVSGLENKDDLELSSPGLLLYIDSVVIVCDVYQTKIVLLTIRLK